MIPVIFIARGFCGFMSFVSVIHEFHHAFVYPWIIARLEAHVSERGMFMTNLIESGFPGIPGCMYIIDRQHV